MQIIPTQEALGARVEGLDVSRPLTGEQVDVILAALGRHGVLEFPRQRLDAAALRRFSASFGELFVSPGGRAQEPGLPEVMNLSNIVADGKPVGLPDAGQSWHTDMSYMSMIALSNILYGITIPQRDGKPLGATQFRDMHAAAATLPGDLRERLQGRRGVHDFEKFWETMRSAKGSTRPPLSETERRARPPVSHPLLMVHPITGREVLYANPGYLTRIEGMEAGESEALLEQVFAHQMRDDLLYEFRWSPGSLLMWDNIGTIHNAVADYTPAEPRHIQRCQVMATRFYPAGGSGQVCLTAH